MVTAATWQHALVHAPVAAIDSLARTSFVEVVIEARSLTSNRRGHANKVSRHRSIASALLTTFAFSTFALTFSTSFCLILGLVGSCPLQLTLQPLVLVCQPLLT